MFNKITFMSLENLLNQELVSQSEKFVNARFPKLVGVLGDLVRIPGIAWEAFDPENLEKSAQAVASLLEGTGVFDWVDIRRAEIPDADGKLGSPAVVARRAAKEGAPQILLYAHHDVQPPGDVANWVTPPFQPTVIDGRIFGRGAADDKAGIVAHLTSIQVLRDMVGPDFELGISVFIEGEEEAGSPDSGTGSWTCRPWQLGSRMALGDGAVSVDRSSDAPVARIGRQDNCATRQ